jgi:uncharacterized RDD family membrane protein YckC
VRDEAGGPPSYPGQGPGSVPGPPAAPEPQAPESPASPRSYPAPSYPEQAAYPPPTGPPTGPPNYPSGAGVPSGAYGSPVTAPYATWAVRLGGYLVDFVIFLVVLVVLLVLFRHSHALDVHLMARKGTRRRNFSAVPFLITGALWIIYGTVLIGGTRGQTVGMMAAGVRAVGDQDRGVLGYGRAFGRALVEGVLRLINLLFFLLGLVWVLDMLFPLWDMKRQTLHDKVVGSVVIRTRPPG